MRSVHGASVGRLDRIWRFPALRHSQVVAALRQARGLRGVSLSFQDLPDVVKLLLQASTADSLLTDAGLCTGCASAEAQCGVSLSFQDLPDVVRLLLQARLAGSDGNVLGCEQIFVTQSPVRHQPQFPGPAKRHQAAAAAAAAGKRG